MGTLIEEIYNEGSSPTNKVTKFIASLSEQDQKDLDNVMRDEKIKTVAIHRVLQRRGCNLRYPLIAEYRRNINNVAS